MKRSTRLVVALLVIGGALTFILWDINAQAAPPAMGVSDAKDHATKLVGSNVTIRGTIREGSIVTDGARVTSFEIKDAAQVLRVEFNQTPPENFGAKEVVVKGTLELDGDVPVLMAHTIQVGCASKY